MSIAQRLMILWLSFWMVAFFGLKLIEWRHPGYISSWRAVPPIMCALGLLVARFTRVFPYAYPSRPQDLLLRLPLLLIVIALIFGLAWFVFSNYYAPILHDVYSSEQGNMW